MKRKTLTAVIGTIAGIAVLFGLAWYTQVRVNGISNSDASFGPILGSVQNAANGNPVNDMGNAASGGTGSSGLPVLAKSMPPFSGITTWLNSKPLTPADLKGKVVLVDFWTYSCINCIRTLPYVTGWYGKYKNDGLVVIGVHTPEFAFEKVPSNVQKAVSKYGISYPVALDNDYGTWNAYNNSYWPAEYLFDAQGRLRYTHFGEGHYDVTEGNIQALLKEAGMQAASGTIDVQSTTDFQQIGSPETYIGYRRQQYMGDGPTVQDKPHEYSFIGSPERNTFYLDGTWNIGAEFGTLVNAPGSITYDYYASNANMVMGAPNGPVRAVVTLDGKPVPAGMRGTDLTVQDGKTMLTVSDQRLYDVIDAGGEYGEHTLKVEFLDAGVQMYTFTFG